MLKKIDNDTLDYNYKERMLNYFNPYYLNYLKENKVCNDFNNLKSKSHIRKKK